MKCGICVILCAVVAVGGRVAQAQTFGIELYNNLMPASEGMAGVSVSRPQDLQSVVNGNPATLRQFQGTQFSFGGAWVDANYHVSQAAPTTIARNSSPRCSVTNSYSTSTSTTATAAPTDKSNGSWISSELPNAHFGTLCAGLPPPQLDDRWSPMIRGDRRSLPAAGPGGQRRVRTE